MTTTQPRVRSWILAAVRLVGLCRWASVRLTGEIRGGGGREVRWCGFLCSGPG